MKHRTAKTVAREVEAANRDDRSFSAKQTLLAVSDRCNWCDRRRALDIHHCAGRTGDLIDDVRFCLTLCRDCHRTIEERIMGEDSLAVACALLRHMDRGSLQEFWNANGRQNWPRAALVEDWSRRLIRESSVLGHYESF